LRNTLTVALAVLILGIAGLTTASAETAAPAKGAGVVNINTADVAQLTLLPRIGPSAAERIIEYRTANGPFRKPTDLMQVKGIGQKSFELLSPYLAVDGKTTLTAKVKGPKAPRKNKPATAAP
jgi:competence protein ComEA